MIFKNNKVYDVLKYLALVVMDAVGTAYSELADIWGLPYGAQIEKTCTVLSILIGALICYSSYKYNKTKLIEQYNQEEDNALEYEVEEDGEE